MPDTRETLAESLRAALTAHQIRFKLASTAAAVVVAAAGSAALVVVLALAGVSRSSVRLIGTLTFFVVAAVAASRMRQWWTLRRAAAAVEARARNLDNLIVTAEESLAGDRSPVHPSVETELLRAAVGRLAAVPASTIQPIARHAAMAVGACLGLVALLIGVSPIAGHLGAQPGSDGAPLAGMPAPGDLVVIVSPPDYTAQPAARFVNPPRVTAIEGSRIRLETASSGRVRLTGPDGNDVAFDTTGDAAWHEMTATTSRVVLVRYDNSTGASERLLQIAVQLDARPAVLIRAPGKDLIFGEPSGTIPVEIEARDDIALASVDLRYTHVSGSGEGFTFEEGRLPLQVERTSAGVWIARTTIALGSLKLGDGDSLVYRALAADRKPGSPPSSSESYLIEIGRIAGLSSTGFALPENRDRQALSQQMLIVKTERLNAEKARLSSDAFAEQARLLAIEQRMVRAEFVFMTGGEIADEVEEATAAHELAEGRLENQGQAELIAATREMSRAEAQLNAADTVRALMYERAALGALQRAFDRRRYLLRALPERARIDPGRRLTGNLADARSSSQQEAARAADPVVTRAREALAYLGRDETGAGESSAALAARLLAVDQGSEALQKAATDLSSAREAAARAAAIRSAGRALRQILAARLAAGGRGRIARDPRLGAFADAMSSVKERP